MSGQVDDSKYTKPRLGLIPPAFKAGLVRVMEAGNSKHGFLGWKDGLPWSLYVDAAHRHLDAFAQGEHLDPETGESHMLHLAACAMILWWFDATDQGEDDRPWTTRRRG